MEWRKEEAFRLVLKHKVEFFAVNRCCQGVNGCCQGGDEVTAQRSYHSVQVSQDKCNVFSLVPCVHQFRKQTAADQSLALVVSLTGVKRGGERLGASVEVKVC